MQEFDLEELFHPYDLLVVPRLSSENLAANIVPFRLFNINKRFAVTCMLELLRRKKLGDDFEYEEFITKKVSEIKSNFDNGIIKFRGMNMASTFSVISDMVKNVQL